MCSNSLKQQSYFVHNELMQIALHACIDRTDIVSDSDPDDDGDYFQTSGKGGFVFSSPFLPLTCHPNTSWLLFLKLKRMPLK